MGQPIRVLGFPNYAPGNAAHDHPGVITGLKKRHGVDICDVDASIFHGNSGGPVLDESGDVIGVARTGVQHPDNENNTEFGVILIDALAHV